ncbi:MAG: TonB-dependent receptor plug domain-containing protein, partial [Gemmatimonadota bacterium]
MSAEAQVPGRDLNGDTITAIALDTVRVGGRIDELIGIATTASEGRVGAADLFSRPISREGELLETVPGVIVTQHSGEGKANQFFIRGFNLDHGTDFQTRVEGMPVNMPTHAHGQGYTDLNFLIPEFVDLLDYRLGVYHAELGDFGSAGGAEFHLARTLDSPFTQLTVGAHGLARLVGGTSTSLGPGHLLVGGETRRYDGPWDVEQDLRKLSGMARYSWEPGDSRISVLAMAYRNRWNASDQIPLRAVESGLIDRFGQIDPTDAGEARRYSLSGSWRRLEDYSSQEIQMFGIYSDLDLFGNFTYFLDRPGEGDQHLQHEQRLVVGGNAKHLQELDALGVPHALTIGVQNRVDLIGEL